MTYPASLITYQLKVQQLRDSYQERTRASLEHLNGYVQLAQVGDAVAQQEMLMIIHRISGSGAMLGFAEVSCIAREIETLLRGDNRQLTAQNWQAIEVGLLQLQAALRIGSSAATRVEACND